MTTSIVKLLKKLFEVHRAKNVEKWLLTKYEPSIRHYNESDRLNPLSHLLIDLGETYLSVSYNEQIGKDLDVTEREFNKASKKVYDKLVHKYIDPKDLDISLYIP